jgi:hypothetical protein
MMQGAEKEHKANETNRVNILRTFASKFQSQLNPFPKARIPTETETHLSDISHNSKQSKVTLEGAPQTGECGAPLALVQKRHSRKRKCSKNAMGNADINIKPPKKTRRSKKKPVPNVSSDNRLGYRATTVLPIQQMLYNRATHEHWPSSHILAESRATLEGACKVLDHILLKDVGEHVFISERVKDDLSDLKKLLMGFIKKHRSLSPYLYLLTHHLESELKKTKTLGIDHKMNSLQPEMTHSETYVKHEQSLNRNVIEAERKRQPVEQRTVSKFVREVLRKVVPVELFGCKQNARVFKRLCSRLSHSGKFQNFRLGNLMSGLKTSSIPWLSSVAEPTVKKNIFAKV